MSETGCPEMQEFLAADANLLVADNYLISVALIFMLRAKYDHNQMTFFNFLVALFLAHEVEEEAFGVRVDIMREAFCSAQLSESAVKFFMKKKEKLWRAIDYDVIVKREVAEEFMAQYLRGNYIWRRSRGYWIPTHSGHFIPITHN